MPKKPITFGEGGDVLSEETIERLRDGYIRIESCFAINEDHVIEWVAEPLTCRWSLLEFSQWLSAQDDCACARVTDHLIHVFAPYTLADKVAEHLTGGAIREIDPKTGEVGQEWASRITFGSVEGPVDFEFTD